MTRHRGRGTLGTVLLAMLLVACGGDTTPSAPPPPKYTPGAAPQITALTMTPAAGAEPGDSVTVHYTVTSGEPLRRFRFYRSGALVGQDSIGARGATAVTDSISFYVPKITTAYGDSITVRMEAVDTLQRVASRTVVGAPIRDTVPPGVFANFGPNLYSSVDSLVFSSQDTIAIAATAWDNGVVRWIGYRLTGAKVAADSMPVDSSPVMDTIRIPLQPSDSGNSSLTVFARDGAGNLREMPARMYVYPVVQLPTQQVLLPLALSQLIYSPAKDLLLGTHGDSIVVLAFSSRSVQSPIVLPSAAGRMDLTPSGDSLLVLLPGAGALAVVDLGTRQLLGTVPLLASALQGRSPASIDAAANGKVFVVLNPTDTSTSRVLEVDLASGTQQLRSDVVAVSSRQLGASGDRQKIAASAYPSCAQLYEAATDQFGGCAAPPMYSGLLSGDAHGDLFLDGPSLLDGALGFVRMFHVPRYSSVLSQLSADGAVAYFATGATSQYGYGFAMVRTSDGLVLHQQALPIVPELLYVLPDGSAVVTQGRVCTPMSATSFTCGALRDLYVTTLK